ADVLKHLSPAQVERYFVKMGESYEVGKRIRNMTVFGQHDLAQRSPFPRIDLCVCRNVLIYFTKDLQTRALQLFAFALRDGGFLVLGKAETTTALPQYFEPMSSPLKIFRRVGPRNLIPATRVTDMPAVALEPRHGLSANALMPNSASRGELRPTASETAGRALLGSTVMGIVVIDRRYDILTLNAAARTMLEIHGVGIGEDLLHSVERIDHAALKALIDAALRGEATVPTRFEVGGNGEERLIRLFALYDSTASGRDTLTLVMFDITDESERLNAAEAEGHNSRKQIEDLNARVSDLAARQKALLKANDELTLANVDLRTTNEQLLINAEESASANEEIETLNEEMQATNEELETLNEELQATVEELNTTNDELSSRSLELERESTSTQDVLSQLTREHAAMARALESTGALVAVYDDSDKVIYKSPPLEHEAFLSAPPKKWLGKGKVTLSGDGEFSVKSHEVTDDGGRLTIVTFSR
ncbi:MAG: hypothetical protein JOY59_02295, partial [Candidatus Eremiobacteraeota bacterium]|nr:hypothetical protein [Candidatus Eremiobacteraeota bacterium]